MTRKVFDVQPVLTARFVGGSSVTDEAAAFAQVEDAIAQLKPDFEVDVSYETDARCEHCNTSWTEQDTLYNGGCCDRDQANDPDRIGALKALAEEVAGAELYRMDSEGRRSRVAVDWPWALGAAISTWLAADRPTGPIGGLLDLASRVDGSDWCTVCSDPGVYPSNAGGSALPDQVSGATEPNDLVRDLVSLIDDMGLTPAPVSA